LILKKTLNMFY